MSVHIKRAPTYVVVSTRMRVRLRRPNLPGCKEHIRSAQHRFD